MQDTDSNYRDLLAGEHIVDIRVAIQGVCASLNAGDGFDRSVLMSVVTHRRLFAGETPTVGNVCAGEIELKMLNPSGTIPRMAKIRPYIRLTSPDGETKSDWLPKGVFYIDTREVTQNADGLDILTIHGYDDLAKTQDIYPSSTLSFPATDTNIIRETDTNIIREIAQTIGVSVDARTWTAKASTFRYGTPIGYSMAEVLSFIAVPHLGNWCMTDDGKLRMISLTELPPETRYLIDEYGDALVFGEDRILV